VEGLRRVGLDRLFRVGVNLDPESALPAPIAADDSSRSEDLADEPGDGEDDGSDGDYGTGSSSGIR
jgi:hypothetical protein